MGAEYTRNNRHDRRERLLGLLERLGVEGALLRTPANFAYYTGGADNRVDRADTGGVAAVLVTPGGEWVVTDNIEASRMREEQTPGMEVAEYPWYETPDGLIRELAGGARLCSDLPAPGEKGVSDELARMRLVLDPGAAERYRSVGSDAEAALSEVSASVCPGTTEPEAAAKLEAAVRRRGMSAAVLIVGGERRAALYRHPVPGAGPGSRLGRRAMLVVCAERGGLYANSTRVLNFQEPTPEERRMQSACDNVLTRAREASRPGRGLSEVLAEIIAAYREEGFPEAWKHHHQGGLTGYASREVIATPQTNIELRTGMAFAFNPSLSATGAFAKAEETFLLTPGGPEILAGGRRT